MRIWYNNQAYQVQGMLFGWIMGPFCSSQTSKNNLRATETVGDPPQLVFRRHPDTGANSDTDHGKSKKSSTTPDTPGHTEKPEEVPEPTSSASHLPGTHLGSEGKQDQTPIALKAGSSEKRQTSNAGKCHNTQAHSSNCRSIARSSQ